MEQIKEKPKKEPITFSKRFKLYKLSQNDPDFINKYSVLETTTKTQANFNQNKTQQTKHRPGKYDYVTSKYYHYENTLKYKKVLFSNMAHQGYCNDEGERQKLIKNQFVVSNILDSYYNLDYHKRSWFPNGQYIVKKRYNHTDSGLEHIYSKNNVEQRLPVGTELPDTKNEFIELNNVNAGDFVITIEYCSSCEEHSNITQHLTDTIFKDLALKYQRIIYERFPFIKVFLKPIDVDIVRNIVFKMNRNEQSKDGLPYVLSPPNINYQFKKCRIGAFELKISSIKNVGGVKTTEIKTIFSKLETKRFPNVNRILRQILSYLPTFKLKLVLFDKENYEELEKMDDIEVKIYHCKSDLVKELSKSIEEQVVSFISPDRRLEMLKAQRLRQTQNPFKRNDTFFGNGGFSNRISSAYPGKKRELSSELWITVCISGRFLSLPLIRRALPPFQQYVCIWDCLFFWFGSFIIMIIIQLKNLVLVRLDVHKYEYLCLAFLQDQFDTIDLSDNEIVKLENLPYLNRLGTLLINNNRITRINPNIGGMV